MNNDRQFDQRLGQLFPQSSRQDAHLTDANLRRIEQQSRSRSLLLAAATRQLHWPLGSAALIAMAVGAR